MGFAVAGRRGLGKGEEGDWRGAECYAVNPFEA